MCFFINYVSIVPIVEALHLIIYLDIPMVEIDTLVDIYPEQIWKNEDGNNIQRQLRNISINGVNQSNYSNNCTMNIESNPAASRQKSKRNKISPDDEEYHNK